MIYAFGDCILDADRHELRCAGQGVAIEPKVFQVLLYLLEHRDRVVTKDDLFAHCWPDMFVSEAALTRCLAKVRQAVQAGLTGEPVIKTIHRQGYRFVAAVTTPADEPRPAQTIAPPPHTRREVPLPMTSPAVSERSAPLAYPADAAPASAAAPRTPTAERRQLTVLSCTLADAARLASQLDPEDLHVVVQSLHAHCTEVIQRFAGHIAQYRRDGLLVYFGYPQAQENDAERAVRAGLGLVDGMAALTARLASYAGGRIAVQVGIHTGPVIIGEMGGGDRQDHVALGETPNVAASLEALAIPDTVVVSAATAHLVEGYFVWQALGEQQLPGMPTHLSVYRVLHESGAQTRLEIGATHGLTPLVGRAQDVRLLVERWEQAQAGDGQVVLLSGEAGIGKSRVVEVLKDHAAHAAYTPIVFRGSPYHQHSAFAPVIAHLQQVLCLHRDDAPAEQLDKLEQGVRAARLPLDEVVPLVAALLSIPVLDRYAPLPWSPQQQKQKTEEALVAWLLAEAERQPVLAVWEDLHWADPSSLEFVSLCIEQAPTARLFMLLTCRPVFQPPWSPRSYLTHLTLGRLGHSQVAQMVAHLTGGKTLPAAVLQQILTKTDGVPLFVEEMTKMVLEAGLLREGETGYELTGPLPALAIPTTLHDALMARLDRLTPGKAVAQLAATIGRQCPYDLLRAVAPWDEEILQRGLRQLVDSELLYQRGVAAQATYHFKHALIQDAAYHALLKRTRQQYHQRIAQVLEAQFPETAATQPELLAQHYTEAGLTEQAIPYWQQAGQHASDHSAYLEAINHVTTGIELLKTLPETPTHTQQAVTLWIALGAALQMAKGHAAPEVEHAYSQAYALCKQVGETPELVSVLLGLWRFYGMRAKFHTARELGDTLLRLSQQAHDPTLAVVAHYALGWTGFCLGALPAARLHLEKGIALYTPEQRHSPVSRIGQDPGVACRAFTAWPLWLLGYPDQALARLQDALVLAQELSHPYSLAYAQAMAAIVSQCRQDVLTVHEHAEAAVALATAQGFPLWAALGTSFRGWALAMQGQGEVGLAQIRQGLAAWRATGAALSVPYLCTVLADVCDHLGHIEDGLQALAEAQTLVEQHEERWWEAEISRLRGVLLLRQTVSQEAEAVACFQQALTIARRQQAKSLELRAASSLARLWQQQGKRNEAYELLAPIYGWFTEGFDTTDLQEAKVLLDKLA